MSETIEVVKQVVSLGAWGALFTALILIIHEPTRAEKLKALILQSTFRLFRWGSKQYLGAKVGGAVTHFLRSYIGRSSLSIAAPRVQIHWVSSTADPILAEDGTLILCMEDSNDQTKNILLAARVALPHILVPTLRSNLSKDIGTAIDLAMLHRLADGLGRHARPLFKRYFLDPEVASERRIAHLFSQLIAIDSKGMFVFIFLEELAQLAERSYGTADFSDKSVDVEQFLNFLLAIAGRELGQEIETQFLSKEFKVGIILVAKTAKAEAQGVAPYLKAVDFDIGRGCDSIYLVGFLPSAKTFNRTIDALDSDNRVVIEKRTSVRITSDMKSNFSDKMYLAYARVIRYMGDATFEERLKAARMQEGIQVDGIVLDVMQDACVVDVGGLRGTLKRAETSWNHVSECSDVLTLNQRIIAIVTHIDLDKAEISLSLRLSEHDPWQTISPPEPGDVIEITFTKRHGNSFFGLYKRAIEITVPAEELSWLGVDSVRDEEFLGATESVQVISRDDQRHAIQASVRILEPNPWPDIHKRFPKNTELRGIVCDINSNYVLVNLEGGLIGHIPRESMLKAGFEFAEYEKTVVRGQGLDVVVTKVFLEKKRIRLDLKRNIQAGN